MRTNVTCSRREALARLATIASGALAAPQLVTAALAQGTGAAARTARGRALELRRLEALAGRLGVAPSEPRPRAGGEADADTFGDMKERALRLLEGLERAAGPQARAASGNAADFLRRIHLEERSLPSPGTRSLETAEATRRALTPPPFNDATKETYRKDFAGCVIRPQHRTAVERDVGHLLRRKPRYQVVEGRTNVPWHVLGVIHNLEASLNFAAHIHNGDDIRRKTRNVPRDRPKNWTPPRSADDWELSAADAMEYDGFTGQKDWSLERILYRLEGYNGWGPRLLRGVKTPYLWSFSNHYERGKYASDGMWDPNLVSQQCGAGVLIKALADAGHIPAPA